MAFAPALPGPAALLLRCLSPARMPDDGLPGESSAWDAAVELAVRHGVAPMAFKRLKQDGARVPDAAWDRLRSNYLASAGRNARLLRHLAPVLAGLREAGIPVIVLKGALLAETVYADPGLRPMNDVDLMVPRPDLARALAVLADMGGVPASIPDIDWCCRFSAHLPEVMVDGLAVEIHWTVVNPAGPIRVDPDGLWQRAQPARVAGTDVLELAPEDLVLHLCLGAALRDRLGSGLLPFCDIAASIRHFAPELDWNAVTGRARNWAMARYAALALLLARELLAVEVPPDAIERLAPAGPDNEVLQAAAEAVVARTGYADMPKLVDLIDSGSFWSRVRLAWSRVFLSREEMAVKYPESRGSRFLPRFYLLRVRDVWRTWRSRSRGRARLMQEPRRAGEEELVRWLKAGNP